MKLTCMNNRCDWRGTDAEMLRAPDPFNPGEEITACPKCRDIHTLDEACDEPECWSSATIGTPLPTGYRRTCFKHMPREGESKPLN